MRCRLCWLIIIRNEVTAAAREPMATPVNSSTVIRFALDEPGEVMLEVFNATGQRVAELARGHRESGQYRVRWDGRDESGRVLSSGVYFYRLVAGRQVASRKLLLVK